MNQTSDPRDTSASVLPLVSIITTCFNADRYIDKAIESVLAQDYPNIEHVIADGASSDKTLAILERHDHLVVDSRPDRGIYDGMNRGIAMARGDILCLLNADDVLEPGAVRCAVAAFTAHADLDILSGASNIVLEDSGEILAVHTPDSIMNYRGIAFGVPVINARFIRRSVFERVGLFSLAFRYAADREWLWRAIQANLSCRYTDQVLYSWRMHSDSATLNEDNTTGTRLWREHIDLAEVFLRKKGIETALRRTCRLWHAVEGTKLLLRGPRTDKSIKRATILARLFRIDPLYPVSLARGLVSWRMRRGRHSDRRAGNSEAERYRFRCE